MRFTKLQEESARLRPYEANEAHKAEYLAAVRLADECLGVVNKAGSFEMYLLKATTSQNCIWGKVVSIPEGSPFRQQSEILEATLRGHMNKWPRWMLPLWLEFDPSGTATRQGNPLTAYPAR